MLQKCISTGSRHLGNPASALSSPASHRLPAPFTPGFLPPVSPHYTRIDQFWLTYVAKIHHIRTLHSSHYFTFKEDSEPFI